MDGAVIIEVLEHVADPDGMLADAFRVLKPNGALCVAVPTSYSEGLYSRLHPRYMTNATHVRVFKKADLCRLIERQGFVVSYVKTENLEAAVAWLFHAILRSEADPTGRMLEHTRIDRIVSGVLRRIERTPGIGRAVSASRDFLGKSYYVFASKRRDPKQPASTSSETPMPTGSSANDATSTSVGGCSHSADADR
jgi:hypothetical protein